MKSGQGSEHTGSGKARDHPIRDYAIVGNCETAALVNIEGGIDWLCLGAFDSPSFFGALIDREKGGSFSLRPEARFEPQHNYIKDTAILETRFITPEGCVKVTDFFLIARSAKARFFDFTSLHPTRKLVRLVELESGTAVRMQAMVAAAPDYARARARWQAVEGGFDCAETSIFSNTPIEQEEDRLRTTFTVTREEPVYFVLDHAERRSPPSLGELREWLQITRAFWKEWNAFNYYRGPHEAMVRRSAMTLKLLTYAPTGAILAAPTTSLPEKPGGSNNWDYRFAWSRDTALIISTLFRLGYSGEAKAFFGFLRADYNEGSKDDDYRLPVLLPIRKETRAEVEELSHLSGYRDSRPVRRGNSNRGQRQYDAQANLLKSLAFWKHSGGEIDDEMASIAQRALDSMRKRWQEPDNGTWESPEPQHYTYSKISASIAFELGCQLGLMEREEGDKLCAEIRKQVLERGLRSREGSGRYLATHYESDEVDGTALRAFAEGFLDDDLARPTREEVERQIGDGPWVYRTVGYRKFGEGAFLLCSFWKIEHLIREERLEEARALLEEHINAASPLGLYSEEIDPASGELWGNFPQAFSHLGLITAVLNLSEAGKNPAFAKLTHNEKFTGSIGRTIGPLAVLAGFRRSPRVVRLLFSGRSKWKKRRGKR